MNKKISLRNIFKGIVVSTAIIGAFVILWRLPFFNPIRLKILGYKTVADRLDQYEENVDLALKPLFENEGIQYPPQNVVLLFIKSQKTLSLYAPSGDGTLKHIKTYKVLAASGKPGPKLKEGDNQVPEGIYSIESLNPNSAFHLSLRVNYPIADDQRRAKEDGRTKLGSDIMIHGNSVSIGCIAIGDEAIEELFVLAAKSNYRKWKLISSPIDFRVSDPNLQTNTAIPWISELYQQIKNEMNQLPANEGM